MQWPHSTQFITFKLNFSSIPENILSTHCSLDAYLLLRRRAHSSSHSAGSTHLRSLPAAEPWTSPGTGWLHKPHTVISKPLSCGVALDTLLYMCLHITFVHRMVRLWFAAWPASISVLCCNTDQIASLMAWDDDTGWNFFQCCSSSKKTITRSWQQTTSIVKHSFSPLSTHIAWRKGLGKLSYKHHSSTWQVTFGFCLSDRFALSFAVLAAGLAVVFGLE